MINFLSPTRMHPKFRAQGEELCTSLDQPDTSCPVNLEQKSAGTFNTAIT